MCRKLLSLGGMLLLVGAAMIATPGSSQAQHGGGHGGGAHIGGGHIGGAPIGGGHIGGAHFGGYGSGVYHGGYHSAYPHTYSYPHSGYSHSYPHYGLYGYSPYYGTYPYGSSAPLYDSGYYGSDMGVTPSYPDTYSVTPSAAGYQAFPPPTTEAPDAASAHPDQTARVIVNVPPDAEVWFEGARTTSTGSDREYQSPPLTPGKRYTYEIRARWNENGHEVTQTQQVGVTAGAHVNVRFPLPPTTGEKGSAATHS